MGLRWISDLVGTKVPSFTIGAGAPATLDASTLSAARTHALPDASGTLATTDQITTAQAQMAAMRAALWHPSR
jgi:hypothetical protein